MGDYMRSLDKVAARQDRIYYPTHGPAINNPQQHVARLIAHRRGREDQIVAHLGGGGARIGDMVQHMYREVDPGLHPAAALSVLAHLLDLKSRGRVRDEGDEWRLGS
jgi:hypothetical protein